MAADDLRNQFKLRLDSRHTAMCPSRHRHAPEKQDEIQVASASEYSKGT